MASSVRSTVLITGGNGALGSAIAIQLEKSQPGRYHLVLTDRNLNDAATVEKSNILKSLGASFEFVTLDLSSLENVKECARKLKRRVELKEIPSFEGGGVVNSAAMITFLKDTRTKDGWSEVYGINTLAQVLLMRELLPVLRSALVVNVSSGAHSMGTADFFSSEAKGRPVDASAQEEIGLMDAMKRYGSTKLYLIMASYALQRRLDSMPNNATRIVGSDPGGMAGSRLGGGSNRIVRYSMDLLKIMRPVVKLFKKDVINPPEVPAKAIADLFGEKRQIAVGGSYFILEDKVQSNPTSLDKKLQDMVWAKVCSDLELPEEI